MKDAVFKKFKIKLIREIQLLDATNMEQLDGQIDRILFRDDESGYSVFYVKVKNISNLVTITGTVPSINDGELVVADGEWINDPKYEGNLKLLILGLLLLIQKRG